MVTPGTGTASHNAVKQGIILSPAYVHELKNYSSSCTYVGESLQTIQPLMKNASQVH